MVDYDDDDIKDFSLPDKPKRFRFNGPEVYTAPAVIPPKVMRELAGMRATLSGDSAAADRFDQIRDLFAKILVPESGERFVERFESVTDPVDLTRQLVPALHWLMEAYGLRPTRPSSPSSDGGDDTSTPSTAGQPPPESTPNNSLHTDGSISSTTGS